MCSGACVWRFEAKAENLHCSPCYSLRQRFSAESSTASAASQCAPHVCLSLLSTGVTENCNAHQTFPGPLGLMPAAFKTLRCLPSHSEYEREAEAEAEREGRRETEIEREAETKKWKTGREMSCRLQMFGALCVRHCRWYLWLSHQAPAFLLAHGLGCASH